MIVLYLLLFTLHLLKDKKGGTEKSIPPLPVEKIGVINELLLLFSNP